MFESVQNKEYITLLVPKLRCIVTLVQKLNKSQRNL